MRVLGIDYGEKYIGLAVGDTDLKIATPFKEIKAADAVGQIKKIIRDEHVEKIVLGLPLSFKMEETISSKKVREFGKQIHEITGPPVEYENEVLTSSQVEREIGEKSHSASAALILQSYFEHT